MKKTHEERENWRETKDNAYTFQFTDQNIILLLILVALITSGISAMLSNNFLSQEWWQNWFQNFSTEITGALFTFIILEIYLRRQRLLTETKDDISRIIEGLRNPEFVDEYIKELKRNGWHTNGALDDSSLEFLELQNLNLSDFKIKEASFFRTKFTKVDFSSGSFLNCYFVQATMHNCECVWSMFSKSDFSLADLEASKFFVSDFTNVDLNSANLKHCDFSGCIFSNANFSKANLEGAQIRGCDFSGANLLNASLKNCQGIDENIRIEGTITGFSKKNMDVMTLPLMKARNFKMDEHTILPDGNYWSPETDLFRFINPKHPNFWQPSKDRIR